MQNILVRKVLWLGFWNIARVFSMAGGGDDADRHMDQMALFDREMGHRGGNWKSIRF